MFAAGVLLFAANLVGGGGSFLARARAAQPRAARRNRDRDRDRDSDRDRDRDRERDRDRDRDREREGELGQVEQERGREGGWGIAGREVVGEERRREEWRKIMSRLCFPHKNPTVSNTLEV